MSEVPPYQVMTIVNIDRRDLSAAWLVRDAGSRALHLLDHAKGERARCCVGLVTGPSGKEQALVFRGRLRIDGKRFPVFRPKRAIAKRMT